MPTFNQYQVKPGVLFTGGTIFVDNARTLDVGAALTAGSGTISADQTDLHLIHALDGYWPLFRSGTSSSGLALFPTTFDQDVVAHLTNPSSGDILVYSPTSGFVNAPRASAPGAPGSGFTFHESASAVIGESDMWYANACTLSQLRLSCRTAPLGSALTAAFKQNGVTLGTLSISAGSTTAQVLAVAVAVAFGDRLSVENTSVGSGTAATGVVAQFL